MTDPDGGADVDADTDANTDADAVADAAVMQMQAQQATGLQI